MDMKKVGLIANILKIAIAAIGAILCFKIIAGDESDGTISAALGISMVALYLCAGIAIIFGLIYFVTNLRKSKGALIGLVGLGIVAAISFSMASSEVTPEWSAMGVTEQISQASGAGIWAVILLLGVAVIASIFSEVSKFFK